MNTYTLSTKFVLVFAHSWFTTAVYGTEFGPIYRIRLKRLNYEDHEDEWAIGATMAIIKDFCINIHIQLESC